MATNIWKELPTGGGSGVFSLNGLTGALSLIAGTNVTIVPGSGTLTINATSSGSVSSVGLSADASIFSVSGSPVTSSGTLSLSLASQGQNTFLSSPDGSSGTPTFRSIVSADIPILNQNTTGTATNVTATSNSTLTTLSSLSLPTSQLSGTVSLTSQVSSVLPIANGGTGQATANDAFNAFAPSQTGQSGLFLTTDGSNTSWDSVPGGSMPSAHLSSTSAVTSATTTYVTAISTTITTTASSAPIHAIATGVFTVTSAVPTVMKYRVSINGVAGQEQLLSLTALTTNYTAAVQYLSASLAPGTYTILFEFARNSGTGTVNFFEGTLDAIGLQGATTNGITSITGAGLTVGPGSGAQTLSGTLTVAHGGTGLASTTANQLLYSSANSVIAGLATANTGALVTNSTGVPSIAAGATANRLLRTNGTTVSFAQAVLTTDVSGILPVANGGTGLSSVASQRIPFGTGSTALATDASFIYDTTNQRLSVGGSGSATGNFLVTTGSKTALQAFNQSAGNAFQAVNVSAWTAALISRQNNGTTGASISLEFGRGTPASPTGCLNGDQIGVIAGLPDASDGVAHGYSGAISFVASEDALTTSTGGEIVLSTTPNGGNILPVERVRIKNSGETTFVNSHLKSTQTTVPTILVSANAGIGSSASLANSTDVAGQLTIVTGIGASTGSYATITFNKAYTVAPIVILTPANGTISPNVYVTSTTTTFDINFAIAGQDSSTYVINYYAVETQ